MRKCLIAVSVVVFLLASVGHSKAQDTGVRPATLKVVLLGTGAGPPMDLQRYGPSTLVLEEARARLRPSPQQGVDSGTIFASGRILAPIPGPSAGAYTADPV